MQMNKDIFYIKDLQQIRAFCLCSDKEDVYKYIYSLQEENKELHNKIDKAIRYIKKNKHYIDIEDMNVYLYEDDIKKVLEILKGRDVDE